ncbi:pyridoxamine 5'-phosphate oxidase-domain-containing protein [Halteromyces radiatus]|uniref:pyridoxamine 5'-phosphate oxidase-domain-containing protein n=1 Tax=Halteromyces radiatus TaxID=101107 RepID=UPI00221E75BB|nr:pyridoxamine 5'-phosphate oxidase-domain-containing protein [Halteromyces radiatus]KAI8086486.1 pyridoxamine 5'-phosphate oxidase-domain-containing protein [Halteromyces radiatus]
MTPFSFIVFFFFLFSFCKATQDVITAAAMARRLVKDTGIGSMLTLMDADVNEEFQGFPFGLMEYYADGCTEQDNGDLLLFMSDLQMNARNARHAEQKVGFTIRALKEYNDPIGNISTPVQQPRLTLVGEVDHLPESLRKQNMACFRQTHKEASAW